MGRFLVSAATIAALALPAVGKPLSIPSEDLDPAYAHRPGICEFRLDFDQKIVPGDPHPQYAAKKNWKKLYAEMVREVRHEIFDEPLPNLAPVAKLYVVVAGSNGTAVVFTRKQLRYSTSERSSLAHDLGDVHYTTEKLRVPLRGTLATLARTGRPADFTFIAVDADGKTVFAEHTTVNESEYPIEPPW
jgi:hypothetical protein